MRDKIITIILILGVTIFHILTLTTPLYYHRVFMQYNDCNFTVTRNLFKPPMIDPNDCGIPEIPFYEWREKSLRPDINIEWELPYEFNITT